MEERVERKGAEKVGGSGESEEVGDVEIGEGVKEEFGGEVGERVTFVGFHFVVLGIVDCFVEI